MFRARVPVGISSESALPSVSLSCVALTPFEEGERKKRKKEKKEEVPVAWRNNEGARAFLPWSSTPSRCTLTLRSQLVNALATYTKSSTTTTTTFSDDDAAPRTLARTHAHRHAQIRAPHGMI